MVLQEITIVIPQGVDCNGKCLEFAREVGFLLCFGTREGHGEAEMVGRQTGMVVGCSTQPTWLNRDDYQLWTSRESEFPPTSRFVERLLQGKRI